MCIKNLEKCNKIMHVAKRNVILLYFSKLQIQYTTNFYMNLFHIIDTYTIFVFKILQTKNQPKDLENV